MIRYLYHNEIHKHRWDDCIEHSYGRIPYALSWWLDAVCPVWDALVKDDYQAVMPLTHGHKYGFNYLYQPFFTQQLGLFSGEELPAKMVSEFITAIPARFRYINIHFNTDNLVNHPDFDISFRKNYLVDLSLPVLELASGYHRNCRRNIQKAIHAGLAVKPGPGPALFARFIQRYLDKKLTGIRSGLYSTLYRTSRESLQNRTGEILGVYNSTGELLAAGWFVTTLGRCLFLVCASTPKGKENQAMYLLVDHVIRKNAGSGFVFDFAGSNSPGIAYFNAGFGARETFYPALRRNNLPWPMRVLKR